MLLKLKLPSSGNITPSTESSYVKHQNNNFSFIQTWQFKANINGDFTEDNLVLEPISIPANKLSNSFMQAVVNSNATFTSFVVMVGDNRKNSETVHKKAKLSSQSSVLFSEIQPKAANYSQFIRSIQNNAYVESEKTCSFVSIKRGEFVCEIFVFHFTPTLQKLQRSTSISPNGTPISISLMQSISTTFALKLSQKLQSRLQNKQFLPDLDISNISTEYSLEKFLQRSLCESETIDFYQQQKKLHPLWKKIIRIESPEDKTQLNINYNSKIPFIYSLKSQSSEKQDSLSSLFSQSKFTILEKTREQLDVDEWSTSKLLKYFAPNPSFILGFLFLGSKLPSENKALLSKYGITHVLNCAGTICLNQFPDEFEYFTLYLLDAPSQDISSLFYPVVNWIDQLKEKNGILYCHCQQGVSRSASMIMAYLIAKFKMPPLEALEFVKRKRYVANPNAGFLAQLILWFKRMSQPLKKEDPPKLFLGSPFTPLITTATTTENQILMEQHKEGALSHQKVEYIFRFTKEPLSSKQLDEKTCIVLQTWNQNYIWVGKEASSKFVSEAEILVRNLQTYEQAPQNKTILYQDKETNEFLNFFSSKL